MAGLTDHDLVILALVRRVEAAPAEEIARRSGLGRWRVRRGLRRLVKHGVVRAGGTDARGLLYVATELGAQVGTAELIVRVLAGIQPSSPGTLRFAAARMRIGGPFDRSPLTGPWHPTARDGIDELARMARDGSPGERAEAILALGRQRDPAVAPKLIDILQDHSDEMAQARAARALGMSGGHDAPPPLRQAAAHGSSLVRAAAVDALGMLADRDSEDILIALLKFPSSPVREAATTALGRITAGHAVPAIATGLADTDRAVRRSAREALVAIATPEAIAALRGAATFASPLGWSAVAQARAAHRRRLRHPVTEPGAKLDRLAPNTYGLSITWFIVGIALIVGAIVEGASSFVVIPMAVVVALWVTWILRYAESTKTLFEVRLDFARARAEPLARGEPTSTGIAVARGIGTRPALALLLLVVPLAIDALAWHTGIASALTAGLMGAWVLRTRLIGGTVARWEHATNLVLLTEPLRDPLQARRYFIAPNDSR